MALLRPRLTVVLHQIRVPENLGAVARLMRNFGFERLVLSEPQLIADLSDAEKMARRGSDLLDRMVVTQSLDEALKDCVYALGTTSRDAIERRATIDPETAVARLAEHAARGNVALVIGGEKRGLSDEDLSRCQDISVIPTEAEPQPSMNLAQATAVMLYLCSRADREVQPEAARPEGARLQVVKVFETLLKDVLLSAEFLNPKSPQYVLEELMQSLHRGQLTQRELELWLGAIKAVDRVIKHPPK
jgi:tRNA/rRNA methyltransferase